MPLQPALRRRIAPSVPLVLELADDSGAKFTRSFRLSFDFNAIALIEERTGKNLLSQTAWEEPSATVISIMFWAAVLANHPEYNSDEGLAVIRSYMDASNAAAISTKLLEAYVASLPAEQQQAIHKKQDGQEADPTQPEIPPA